ncbi:FMRFamide receptor-like [Littorina saxatilis]|uniref:FMRFamide receptor-like n=1 Tax=Littorina saxatilis TaxID=31220 RepID=UPI0038B5EDD3
MRIRFELYPDNVYPYLIPPLRHCLTLHTACAPGGDPVNASRYSGDWTEVSDYFCFLALPVVVSFAVATQVASVVVLCKMPARASLDTYLLGLCAASLLLLAATSLLASQHYVGRYEAIIATQPYAFSCRDWFWYTTIWLIVMMAFERALSVSSSRASVLCTPTQAGVVVLMVFCVGLVSALPRFWEYDTARHFDLRLNATAPAATKTASTATEEYNTMYFWYVKTLTLFLPYVMMAVTGVTLVLRSRGEAQARRYTAVKHASATALARRMKDETALSKLLVLLMAMYVTFSTPLCLLELMSRVLPDWLDQDTRLFAALHNLFTVLFFLHYALHLILYFCYNKQFRLTLLDVCCCCC